MIQFLSRMKTCTKCSTVKSDAEFYRHPRNLDGRSGKCKECTKEDVRANRRKRNRILPGV